MVLATFVVGSIVVHPVAARAGSKALRPRSGAAAGRQRAGAAAIDMGPDAALLLRYHTHFRQGRSAEPQPFVVTSGLANEAFELHDESTYVHEVRPALRVRDANGVRVPTARELQQARLGDARKVRAALAGWVVELAGVPGDVGSAEVVERARGVLSQQLASVEPLLDAVIRPREQSRALGDLEYRAVSEAVHRGTLDPRMPSLRRLGHVEIADKPGTGLLALTYLRLPSTGSQELVVGFVPAGGQWRVATVADLRSMGIGDLPALEAAARVAHDKL